MVDGGAAGGLDICCGGHRFAISLPVSSAIDVDVPCQRTPCLFSRCHPTSLPPPTKTAEEAGSDAAKNTTVSDGNLSPPPAAANLLRSGTHLPPLSTAGPLSSVSRHRPPKPLLPPPYPPPLLAAILALVMLSTACRLCKDVATLPLSQQSPPHSACIHCSVRGRRPLSQPLPRGLTAAAAVACNILECKG
jgi:hypothetical protein